MNPSHLSKTETHLVEKHDKSIGELLGDLTTDVTMLVKQEMALAKAELSQKASEAGKNVGFIAAGGALAYAGLLVLLGALVVILVEAGMALWLAALLVGLVCAVAGGYLAKQGLDKLRQIDMVPRQTIQTIKETTK